MNHKTEAEKEFNLPPLTQMNDMVLEIALKYAHDELKRILRKGKYGGATENADRVRRKISLLEGEVSRRVSDE